MIMEGLDLLSPSSVDWQGNPSDGFIMSRGNQIRPIFRRHAGHSPTGVINEYLSGISVQTDR